MFLFCFLFCFIARIKIYLDLKHFLLEYRTLFNTLYGKSVGFNLVLDAAFFKSHCLIGTKNKSFVVAFQIMLRPASLKWT